MADQDGFLKVRITTALILAGIIFLASLLSGWITQNKELGNVQADQKALHIVVGVNSNRITVLEQCVLSTKQDLVEMKGDIKEIQRDQREFYQKMGKKFDK